MITREVQHRIEALSPKAKRIFIQKLQESLAATHKGENGRKRIVAYIQGDQDFPVDQLKSDLQKQLPDYMVPSLFIPIQTMPLLPNGKIDRQKLTKMPLPVTTTPLNNKKDGDAASVIEQKLIAIWEEVLGFSPIHRDDNFFEIGGDSILSIQIIAKARKIGLVLESNAVFEHQTIAQLASFSKDQGEDKGDNFVEQTLISIWEKALGFSPVQIDDNFFEIGGDSILSIQIIARAREKGLHFLADDLFNHQTIRELAPYVQSKKTAATLTENVLIQIWEETLGFSPIHRDDNFFEIGGDSILSIQIIAKAREKGMVLSPNDLFQYQTIAQLSLLAKKEEAQGNTAIVKGKVLLSPIQQWFFEVHKNMPNYWNQGVQLDGVAKATEDQLAHVCNYLITQHDALRARFIKAEEQWSQEIIAPEAVCALEFITIPENDPLAPEQIAEAHLKRIQNSFDLSKGSLFKCIYFKNTTSAQDFCILIAHHLLVDAVSWQIIIDDFTTALREISEGKQISQNPKSDSFKDWVDYVYTYGKEITAEEYGFWKSQITAPSRLPVDKENLTILEEKDIVQLPFSFDENTTTSLLKANQTLNTKTEELLITAFVAAIGKWIRNSKISIGFERHGRETEGSGLDVSKTVGWFTTYFPMQFDFKNSMSIDGQMIAVKEKMRSIPKGGIGYGALKYRDADFKTVDYPDIVFNFLGTRRDAAAVDTFRKKILTDYLRDPRSERHYKLEVNMSIIDGVLQGAFSYGDRVHNKSTIDTLLNSFKTEIKKICDYCNQADTKRYTPSDFSDTDISQDDLDSLLDMLD